MSEAVHTLSSSFRATARARRALFRREIAAFFQTPVAYVAGVVFLVISGTVFFSLFFLFERAELRQFFANLPVLFALLVPALAMRLIAEERRRGTFEILATLPLRPSDIIVAKFAAVWVTTLFLLLPTLFYAVSVATMGPLDAGPVAGGYLGAALLAGAFCAVGVFGSTIARNETIALIVSLVIGLLLTVLDSFLLLIPAALVPLFEYVSFGFHFQGFTRGVIDVRSVIYFLSIIALFLTLAERRLRAMR